MTQVLAASLVGAWTHGRGAMVHRKLALVGGSAMALAALAGGVASHFVSGRTLLAMFAVMATTAFPLMFIPPVRGPGGADGGETPFHRVSAVVLGSVVGAPLGARLSHRAPVTLLRALLGALIAVVMVRVWVDVLSR